MMLRNGWYTENDAGSIFGALAGGAFIGSSGEGKISSATRADDTEAVVGVLSGTGHDGKIYGMTGDEAWTLRELAAEISRETGKAIPYKNLLEAGFAAALKLKSCGLPDGSGQQAIAGRDMDTSTGALFDDSREHSKLINQPTTCLSFGMAEALRAAKWTRRGEGVNDVR
jgi:NAD(P)H dehydrogenase (quinone)